MYQMEPLDRLLLMGTGALGKVSLRVPEHVVEGYGIAHESVTTQRKMA